MLRSKCIAVGVDWAVKHFVCAVIVRVLRMEGNKAPSTLFPKYNELFYTKIQSKQLLYLGTE